MSIEFIAPMWHAGNLKAVGSRLTSDAATEADYVSRGAAKFTALARTPIADQEQPSRNGSIFIELGLSLVDQGYAPQYTTAGGVFRQFTSKSVMAWVNREIGGALTILHSAGKSGDTVEGCVARFAADVAARTPKPNVCALWIGGNDMNQINSTADIEEELASMAVGVENILAYCKAAGIRLIVHILPVNASWLARPERYYPQWRFMRWCYDFARRNALPVINFNSALATPTRPTRRPITQIGRTSNVVTVRQAAHGYSVGQYVLQSGIPQADPLFAAFPVQITTVGSPTADDFTYAQTGGNISTGPKPGCTFGLIDLIAARSSDHIAHLSAAGASALAKLAVPVYKALFPPIDDRTDSEGDYCNLVGTGLAATNETVVSRGMMEGTGGTLTGTASSHTGNVPAGWDSNVISGNPTSVMASVVARSEAALSHQKWARAAVVAAAGADCEWQLHMTHSKPSAWTASTSRSLGAWMRPNTENGYFYVALAAGSTGTNEPVWPTTPGLTVVDGTVTWECREGWQAGDKVYATAEYMITDMSDAAAIQSLAFGLFDESASSRSITDFDFTNESAAVPLYSVSTSPCVFKTTEATIDAATTQLNLAMKLRVTANKNATVQLGRVTWRKVRAAI